MKHFSLKLKITLWFTLAMVVISSVVFVAMLSISKEITVRDVSNRLTRTVTEFSRIIAGPDGKIRFSPKMRFYEQGVHMVLYDKDKKVLGGQLPFGISFSDEFKNDKLIKKTYMGEEYYIYDKHIPVRDYGFLYLRGVISAANEQNTLDSYAKTNVIIMLIMIFAASVGGYFIISKAFVPVNKISETAKKISQSTDLSQRIGIKNSKDEISSLANTFDEMLEQIEKSFEREKQFTSDASHELRTPVAVMLSECEFMLDCAKTDDEFRESAESIRKQADKMSKLISELLMISRMNKNTMKLDFEEIDVSELINFVCDEQEEIHENSIVLMRDIKPGIMAQVDRFLISRLFINLISNAYQYSNEGGTITVELDELEGNIIFSVIDNGIGIDEKHIEKIWERFYQVDDSRTVKDSGSMGLGLSMVKQIAQCHNGDVSVNSEFGKGSGFTFIFPKGNTK